MENFTHLQKEGMVYEPLGTHLLALTITNSWLILFYLHPWIILKPIIHAIISFINILDSIKDKYCLKFLGSISPIFSAVSDHNVVPLNYSLTKTFEAGFCCCFGGIKPFYWGALGKGRRVGGQWHLCRNLPSFTVAETRKGYFAFLSWLNCLLNCKIWCVYSVYRYSLGVFNCKWLFNQEHL